MIRVIKRYESRKLYDTEESRYVSLEDIARWVREGQQVQVVDNGTSEDVSAQVLTQIILDEGKRGTSFLPTELLHDLVRAGEKAVASGVRAGAGPGATGWCAARSTAWPWCAGRARRCPSCATVLAELERTLRDLELHDEEEEPARASSPAAARPRAAGRPPLAVPPNEPEF